MALRPLAQEDLAIVRAWRNAPEVRRNVYTNHVISESEDRAWFARLQDDSQSTCFIYENDQGETKGTVFFSRSESSSENVFWDFYTDDNARRKFATRIGFESLEKGFGELKLHKLNVEVLATHEQSLRFHKKLGFQEEGRFRDFYFDGHMYIDAIRLGILSSEWNAKRGEVKSRIAHLDALAQTNSAGYRILILTDRHSWISPYVEDLAEEWEASGIAVELANDIDHISPADFCFCLSFSQLVPASVREQFRHTLVVHESDLPKGRGWAPMTWQILEGQNQIPVMLLEAVAKIDAGPVYLTEWIGLKGTELNEEWRKLQAEATKRLCLAWVSNYPAVLEQSREQQGEPEFFARRRPEDSELDAAKTLYEQFNLLRVVDNENYPAFFEVKGRRFILEIYAAK